MDNLAERSDFDGKKADRFSYYRPLYRLGEPLIYFKESLRLAGMARVRSLVDNHTLSCERLTPAQNGPVLRRAHESGQAHPRQSAMNAMVGFTASHCQNWNAENDAKPLKYKQFKGWIDR
jgi:hypothetical protein